MLENIAISNFQPPAPLHTAVLLLVFNRPDSTARVLQSLSKAKPPRLYVAGDGPRAAHPDDQRRCAEVRNLLQAINWPCEVLTRFREENLGCKRAVSDALSWFFAQEDEGIVLEDDCVPEQSFFWYCEELLGRYRHNRRIGVIGGLNFGPLRGRASSYYFTKYSNIWGWASWRRYWKLYDGEMSSIEFPELLRRLEQLSDGNRFFVRYWADIYLRCSSKVNYQWRSPLPWSLDIQSSPHEVINRSPINSWAYPLLFTGFMQNPSALHIVPSINLIQNIGFSESGTHTTDPGDHWVAEVSDLRLPLRSPTLCERDVEADRLVDTTWYRIGLGPSLRSTLLSRYPLLRRLRTAVRRVRAPARP